MDKKSRKKELITFQVHSVGELKSVSREISKRLDQKGLLLIEGPMGAGKTHLVKDLLATKGFNSVTSPTYALHQEYSVAEFIVDHFDLYRIKDEDDLESSGFWDCFHREKGWIIVEWSERVNNLMWPPNWPVFQVVIEVKDQSRFINFYF